MAYSHDVEGVSEIVVGYGPIEPTDAFEEGVKVGRWDVRPRVIGEYELEQVLFWLRVVLMVVLCDELQV